MVTTILSFLLALLKAIPKLVDLWREVDQKRTKVSAQDNLDAKNSSVDASIAAHKWVPASDAEQLAEADEKARLRASSNSSPGVVQGRPEDNQPT